MSTLSLEPVGYFHSLNKYSYETASQPNLDQSENPIGRIELVDKKNMQQALQGLAEMSHIWVLFWFHEKSGWNPMVQVPRGLKQKIGVFATRSPHRPNPIGMSLLELESINDRTLVVKSSDLLDGTPILDIKPFHPQADLPLNPRIGWLSGLDDDPFAIASSSEFEARLQFLCEQGVTQILSFCRQQLRFEPLSYKQKRVSKIDDSHYILAYRTWRISFEILPDQKILLNCISSGYSPNDLLQAEDKWQDKDIHREFDRIFGRK